MRRIGRIGTIALSIVFSAAGFVGCGLTGQGNKTESSVENTSFTALSPKHGKVATLANDELAEFAAKYEAKTNCAEPYYGKGDHYAMKGLTLEWSAETPAEEYEVSLSLSADMRDAMRYTTTETSLFLSDLFVNSTYYWQVKGGEATSSVFSFQTANTPRTIFIEGVSNTRDIGGKNTEEGGKIRQGIAYRGAKLDDITETGKKQFLETYGIKSDLDLRAATEGYKGASPVGDDVAYRNYSCPYYTGANGLDNSDYYEALASALRVFTKSENFPVYFHCSIGRDRTSMIAMLLLGVCGVSTEDIALDYETSFFSESGCLDGASVANMTRGVDNTMSYIMQFGKKYDGNDSFQRSCEAYLLRIGMTEMEIFDIRQNLIEE